MWDFKHDNSSNKFDLNYVSMLNKYLKYKNKYLSLKNK